MQVVFIFRSQFVYLCLVRYTNFNARNTDVIQNRIQSMNKILYFFVRTVFSLRIPCMGGYIYQKPWRKNFTGSLTQNKFIFILLATAYVLHCDGINHFNNNYNKRVAIYYARGVSSSRDITFMYKSQHFLKSINIIWLIRLCDFYLTSDRRSTRGLALFIGQKDISKFRLGEGVRQKA